MKKNAMLKIAAILVVAVLLTTCAISATFAKYVTENVNGTVTARVAKWGVEVHTDLDANVKTLFLNKYTSGPSGDAKGSVGGDFLEVTDKVLAPGTNKSVTIASLVTGKPEVSGKITTSADLVLGSGWKYSDDSVYCPLVFTVGEDTFKIDKTITSVDLLEKAVEGAIATLGTTYFEANADVSKAVSNFTIGWAWAFDAGDNNVKDTYLADLPTPPSLTLTITVGVAQTGPAVGA